MTVKENILQTQVPENGAAIFYLGQESILVKRAGKYLLFDGYLSDYVDRNCSGTVTWRRRYPAPIEGGDLDFVDYVFCSHAHYDHADPLTLAAIARVNAKAVFIVPAPIVGTVKGYGVPEDRILPALADVPIKLGAFSVLPVPAAHEELEPDANGRYAALGYRVQMGDLSLFHAGDSCVYEGLSERLGEVDVMCLPVNGRSWYKRYVQDIIGNMTADEAAELAYRANAKLLVPMHFDLYDVNCVSPAAVAEALAAPRYTFSFHLFRPGERYLFMK